MSLGRYCWIKMKGNNGHVCIIICTYQLCEKPSTSPMFLGHLNAQQRRYYMERGKTGCPKILFREELGWKIKKWQQKYERIILIMNANEYMNKGKLLRSLTQLGIQDLVNSNRGKGASNVLQR